MKLSVDGAKEPGDGWLAWDDNSSRVSHHPLLLWHPGHHPEPQRCHLQASQVSRRDDWLVASPSSYCLVLLEQLLFNLMHCGDTAGHIFIMRT